MMGRLTDWYLRRRHLQLPAAPPAVVEGVKVPDGWQARPLDFPDWVNEASPAFMDRAPRFVQVEPCDACGIHVPVTDTGRQWDMLAHVLVCHPELAPHRETGR